MKILQKLFIFTVFSIFFHQITYAVVTVESCTTGTYASYYANMASCNKCGYLSHNFYVNTLFDTWDFFHNDNTDKIISGRSFGVVTPLNNSNLTIGTQPSVPLANFIPAGVGANGANVAPLFLARNLSFTTPVASRTTPIAQAEYNTRAFNVVSNGNMPLSGFTWSYYLGSETLTANGLYNLTANQINLGSQTKSVNNGSPLLDKECYVFLGAWCGDGVVDSGYETCDIADTTHTGWGTGGCDASCQAITTPVVPTACTPGTTVGVQTTPITAT
ncbi:MAG: hypothetical protein PHQ95_04200, partial [Candidatus Gracilibacteria bacterium]|nr:hypothetical protein [Candidatus Gracilibacteria bacterium]